MVVKHMDSLELGKLLLEKGLANQEQAESLIREDIDGEILSSMSAEQLTSVLGYNFGRAMRLVNWLRANVISTSESDAAKGLKQQQTFQGGRDSKAMDKQNGKKPHPYQGGREATSVIEEKGSRERSAVVKPSSNRRRMRKISFDSLPPDPVIDGSTNDLYYKVFGKKPTDIPSTVWGKGYLENYHPKAHVTHNRNVEKMRGFFSNIYDPVVAKAWTSNFKQEKIRYKDTLEFIEACVPDLEELVLTIKGVSMHINWKAENILKGWFLDHKKHHSSRRTAQIAAIEAEDNLFLESLPSAAHSDVGEATYVMQSADHSTQSADNDFLESLPLVAHSNVGEAAHLVQSTDHDGFVAKQDTSESETEIIDQESKTEIIDTDSQGWNESQTSDATLWLKTIENQASDDEKSSKTILLEGHKSSNSFEQKSPEHKRLKLSPMVVPIDKGVCIPRAPLKAIPGGLIRRHKPELKIVEPAISNTSTNAHSPNQSMTSTETDDSIKLKQPKKQIEEVYAADQAHHEEFAVKSEKMSKLSSIRNPKNKSNKENFVPSSMVQVSNGKFNENIPRTVQTLGFENLDEDAKLTIAYKAMRLSNKKEVKPQLKSFMAAQNNRVQLFNERASQSDKMNVPFSGHQKLEVQALLNLLVKWALEFKVEIVNGPKPINGKVRLFSQHIQDKH